MKIIKRVELNKIKWFQQFTCTKCTSVIEVGLKDLDKIPGEQDGPPYYSCRCPVCFEYKRFNDLEIPKNAI